MKKYIVNGLTGFSLLSDMEEIESKNPKEAIKLFIKKTKPDKEIINIFADRKFNTKPYNISVSIFEGYKNENGNFSKIGNRGFYLVLIK